MLPLALVTLFYLVQISATESDSCCACNTKREDKEEFAEGQNVIIVVEGDHYGVGCKFEFQIQEKEQNITCCYIHSEGEREKLCGNPTQHEACRKKEEYDVQEIRGSIGACSLTLFKGKQSDSGPYWVHFPNTNEVKERRVNVKKLMKSGLNWYETLFICVGMLLFVVICISFYIFILGPQLKAKNEHNRKNDEEIMKTLMETNVEELMKKLGLNDSENSEELEVKRIEWLKEKLGDRNILGLKDRHNNNIFHLAARADWTQKMTELVFKICRNQNDEDTESFLNKTIFNLRSRNIIPIIFPDYLLPDSKMHWKIDLNTRNSEGNTPLIIASKEKRLDVLSVLFEKRVKLHKKNNDGYTALHQAVEKKNIHVVEELLKRKAKQNTVLENGKTPLHTAIERKSLTTVKLLFEALKRDKISCLPTSKDKIKSQNDSPLYLAVKSGFYDITEYLAEKEEKDWQGEDENLTVYGLVEAGHKEILKYLICKFDLKWASFHESCILEAIKENNRQAVNNVYSLVEEDVPNDEVRVKMLKNAKDKLSRLQSEKESEVVNIAGISKINSIIEKLEKEGKRNDEDVPVTREDPQLTKLKGQLKEKKEEYFKYITGLKKEPNGDIWRTLDDVTKKHTEFTTKVMPLRDEIDRLKGNQN